MNLTVTRRAFNVGLCCAAAAVATPLPVPRLRELEEIFGGANMAHLRKRVAAHPSVWGGSFGRLVDATGRFRISESWRASLTRHFNEGGSFELLVKGSPFADISLFRIFAAYDLFPADTRGMVTDAPTALRFWRGSGFRLMGWEPPEDGGWRPTVGRTWIW